MQQLRKRAAVLAPLAVLALGAAACGGSSSGSSAPSSAGGGTSSATGSASAPSSAGASTSVGNSVQAQASVQQGGTLTFAYAQSCPGFNINNGNDALEICNLIVSPAVMPGAYDVYPDFSLHYDPNLLASEPTQDSSSGNQVITYKINPNAKWSDGTDITADDFIYMWNACNGTNAKYQCASTTGLDQIQSVDSQDSGKTVVVTYKKPFIDWKSLFGALLPSHIFKPLGPDGFNKKLEGTPPDWTGGPFKVSNFVKDQSVTLSRWDGYYGQKANLDSVTFRFLTDESTEPQALANKEVQLIYPQPQLDLIQQVKNIPNVTSETNLGAVFEHFDFNQKNPILADKQVRLAIMQGTDRQQLLNATIKQFTDKAQPLNNRIFMPGQQGYQDNSGGMGQGNAAQAAKTLEADGYAKSGGFYAKGGKTLELSISTTSGNQLRQNQEAIFKQQMQKIGIKIDIKNYPASKLFGDVIPNLNYDICDFAWVGTPTPISSNVDLYKTKGGENWLGYSNPQVDQLLQQAVTETDQSKAVADMNQVDTMLWQDAVTLPLYQKPTFIAYYNNYVNIQDNPTSAGPVWNIAQWGMKSQ